MPKHKKHPKDMTTEELARVVFHPKLHQKLREKIKEIDENKRSKSDSKLSSQ